MWASLSSVVFERGGTSPPSSSFLPIWLPRLSHAIIRWVTLLGWLLKPRERKTYLCKLKSIQKQREKTLENSECSGSLSLAHVTGVIAPDVLCALDSPVMPGV